MRDVCRIGEHVMFTQGMTAKKPTRDLDTQIGDILVSLLRLANQLNINAETALTKAIDAAQPKCPANDSSKNASSVRWF